MTRPGGLNGSCFKAPWQPCCAYGTISRPIKLLLHVLPNKAQTQFWQCRWRMVLPRLYGSAWCDAPVLNSIRLVGRMPTPYTNMSTRHQYQNCLNEAGIWKETCTISRTGCSEHGDEGRPNPRSSFVSLMSCQREDSTYIYIYLYSFFENLKL